MLILVLFAAATARPATLRLDYFHTGSATEEGFARDGLVLEGPWPGNPRRPLDELNLGESDLIDEKVSLDTLLLGHDFSTSRDRPSSGTSGSP